ncbi:MAG: hypothetical protein MUC51_10055 [Anaerolineae bacterium]|nr:hypothetical protein [Anaerolineae bacterium]
MPTTYGMNGLEPTVEMKTDRPRSRPQSSGSLIEQALCREFGVAHLKEAANIVAEGSQVARVIGDLLESSVNKTAHPRLYRLKGGDHDECGDDKRQVAFLAGHCNEEFLA